MQVKLEYVKIEHTFEGVQGGGCSKLYYFNILFSCLLFDTQYVNKDIVIATFTILVLL